ncbi:hypothetical protein [Maridesulfovibrio sp.]|uniref:hypothetical protein n=1 Tax=Maridesulfovibrio sp. TaxID=2795000 RepID=UPI003BA9CF74
MTRPYFEKTGDNVIAHGNGASGPVALDKEYPLLEKWREAYQNLYISKPGADAYKELGNEMLAWLKGNGLWDAVRDEVHRNGFLEIRVLPGELRWTE